MSVNTLRASLINGPTVAIWPVIRLLYGVCGTAGIREHLLYSTPLTLCRGLMEDSGTVKKKSAPEELIIIVYGRCVGRGDYNTYPLWGGGVKSTSGHWIFLLRQPWVILLVGRKDYLWINCSSFMYRCTSSLLMWSILMCPGIYIRGPECVYTCYITTMMDLRVTD